jgi:tRNA/rRNA methyltransferase/tRNA (cytidine32/uridine32-2'-O)-methyltransferase
MNLGAAARALRSAGIDRWAWVDPRTDDFETARTVAVHSEELLGQARVAGSLAEALEGCALSVGTTARARHERPALHPREAVERLAAAQGEVALVFGDERSGLRAEEIDALDLVATIPSAPEQPSWNLAQCIAVFAYEVRLAAQREQQARPPPEGHRADPAQMAGVERALAAALEPMGWARKRRRLAKALHRAQLTEREAQLWTALWVQLGKRR